MGILNKLGVKEIINASGTLTVLGGSRLREEALKAIVEVSDKFVDIQDLHIKAGRYIANLVGAKDALITDGAAAGLVLAVAAAITGGNVEKMAKIPFVEDMNNEVIIQYAHTVNNPYYQLISIPGAKLKIAGNQTSTGESDVEKLINNKTAAIVHFLFEPQENEVPLERVVSIAHNKNVPVIVDAAAELPPKENLWRLLKVGADVVIFSGGKEIGGPNDTGIILGNNEEIIENCRKLSYFSYLNVNGVRRTFFGRVLKMSKEDVVAFVAAFEAYLKADEKKRMAELDKMANKIVKVLCEQFPQITTEISVNRAGDRTRPVTIPKVVVKLPRGSAEKCRDLLKNKDPPIYVSVIEDGLIINPQCLTEKELDIMLPSVASAIHDVLNK